ncbi:hypothetical protein CYLTODRAFT_415832, partial [Cylindrobasidium torrendii FP15055 ss-10]
MSLDATDAAFIRRIEKRRLDLSAASLVSPSNSKPLEEKTRHHADDMSGNGVGATEGPDAAGRLKRKLSDQTETRDHNRELIGTSHGALEPAKAEPHASSKTDNAAFIRRIEKRRLDLSAASLVSPANSKPLEEKTRHHADDMSGNGVGATEGPDTAGRLERKISDQTETCDHNRDLISAPASEPASEAEALSKPTTARIPISATSKTKPGPKLTRRKLGAGAKTQRSCGNCGIQGHFATSCPDLTEDKREWHRERNKRRR